MGGEAAHLRCSSLQRSFRSVDGCLVNGISLELLVRNYRTNIRPYNIISLELRKAFDAVSHHSIRRALEKAGVPRLLKGYIIGSFTDVNTRFEVGCMETDPIPFKRGSNRGTPILLTI